MNANFLEKYINKTGLIANAKVKKIGYGESNVNYVAESGNKKLIIRTARPDVPNKPRFENEHHFMKFIEHVGLSFAPKSLIYDPKLNIHVISFISGKDASVIDLDGDQINTFIAHLKTSESLQYEEYVKWCEHENIQTSKPQTPEEILQLYYASPMQYIKNSKKDRFSEDAYKWIEEKSNIILKKQVKLRPKVSFRHGDLRWNKGGGNLRVSNEDIYFIDWELSRFVIGVPPEISDIFSSIPYTNSNKLKMRKLYDSYMLNEKDPLYLNEATEYGLLKSKLGNIIWAVHRYCFLEDTNQQGATRYEELARAFIKDADIFFSKPFNEWF